MTRAFTALAHAKLNLALAVERERPDGYHDLRSVMIAIDLADRVRVARSRRLEVRVAPGVDASPDEELAGRAVRALAAADAREPAAFVHVRKRIPVGAGLGGGSSDAGAVLRMLARVWRLDGADLVRVAAAVGSDVPFFASGAAAAYVSGRGEIVEPLPPALLHVVLVRPRIRLATRAVFAEHREADRGATPAVERLREAFVARAVTPRLVREHSRNDLLGAAERLCPEIADTRARAAARGVELVLTGSGPALFAVADDRRDALRIARLLRRLGLAAHAHAAVV